MASKKVRDTRKLARGRRRYNAPFAFDIVPARIRSRLGDSEIANLRVLRCSDLPVRVIGTLERPLHVGLTRPDPYVTDEYVGQPDRVLAVDDEFVWSPRFGRFKVYLPAAVPRCCGDRNFPAKGNAYGFSGGAPAPDVNRHATLHDHVVAEQRRDPHIGPEVGKMGSIEKHQQKKSHRAPIFPIDREPIIPCVPAAFYPAFLTDVRCGRTGAPENLYCSECVIMAWT